MPQHECRARGVWCRASPRCLSIEVSTNPFWDSADLGDRVGARMALKHAHEPAESEDRAA
ncbi:hypothetical protein ABT097_27980 [Streptomyces sp. NPDC002225]|uniref:hypothetical protein n=1 Tax=Streptomyces sp. NPDC002225 TaxID=3154413 RepID=UPI003326B0B4